MRRYLDNPPGGPRFTWLDATQAGALIGVDADTIRSWVHRGHLPPGRFTGGVLRWTPRQIRQAQAEAAEGGFARTAPLTAIHATCRCGEPVTVGETAGSMLLFLCRACGAKFLVDAGSLPKAAAFTPPALVQTSIDPDEAKNGPYLRAASMRAYVLSRTGQPQVYFIRLGPYVKIGTSVDVMRRIVALSLSSDHVLATVDGGRDVERQMHKRFRIHHAFREWYYLRDDLLDFCIQRQRAQVSLMWLGEGA